MKNRRIEDFRTIIEPIKDLPEECPWCHNKPVIIKESLFNGNHGYKDSYKFYVACKNKNCKIRPRTKSYDNVYGMSEQECINKSIGDWNTR